MHLLWEKAMNEDPMRGTGRTTRMLEQAVVAAKGGELVGIAAYSYAYARRLCDLAVKMGAPRGRVIPLSPNGSSYLAVDRTFRDHYIGGVERR